MLLTVSRVRPRTQLAKQSGERLTKDERDVQQAVTAGIARARERVRSRRLRAAIESNNVADVETSIDLVAMREVFEPLEVILEGIGVKSAREAAKPFRLEGRFNFINQDVVTFARNEAAKMVQRLTDEQLVSVRNAIVSSVSGEFTIDETSKIIRASIGLTDRYRKAVETRFMAVKRQAERGGLPAAEAARLATRAATQAADRLLRARARTIARTEVAAAQNAGKMITWKQAVDRGTLEPSAVKRWLPAADACDICLRIAEEFNESTDVPVLGEFYSVDEFGNADGYWHDQMPPVHPNCRCTVFVETRMSAAYAELVAA